MSIYGLDKLRQQQMFAPVGNPYEYTDPSGGLPMYDQPSAPTYQGPYQDPDVGRLPSLMPDSGIEKPKPHQMPLDKIGEAAAAVDRFYTRNTEATDRYNDLLDNPPEMNSPGILRALVAGAVSQKGGLDAGAKVLYSPYLRDKDEWTTKATQFQQAAQQENTQNVNERTLAGNVLNNLTAQEKIDETRRSNEAKEEAALIRAKAYSYSQRLGKGFDWDLTGPTAKKFNKDTGQLIDTGIPTGKMSEELRIELENEGKIAAAQQSGVNQQTAATARGWVIVQDRAGNKWRINETTGETLPIGNAPPQPTGPVNTIGTPGSSGGGTNTLETDRVEQNAMQDLWETSQIARRNMTRSAGGVYAMKPRPDPKPPGTLGFGGVTQAQADEWDQVKKQIDPSYIPPVQTGQPGQQAGQPIYEGSKSNPQNMRRSTDKGQTWQYSTDGGKTWR